MKNIVSLAALGGLIATGALAQPSLPAPANPAVRNPQANVSGSPVAGANSFTKEQAQAQIEKRGFTRVSGLVLDDKGIWRGQAMRNGQSVPVTLDFQGNVN
jgi:hypothetical protein